MRTPARSAAIARRDLAAVLLAAVAVALGPGRPAAQTLDPLFPITNGSIASMAVCGDTLYVTGHFTWIGSANGSAVAFDAATGEPVAPWPRIHARVVDGWFYRYATVTCPDDEGGCFVGGNFLSVSGVPRMGLAHVRSDGSVDAWDPGLGASSSINTIVRLGGTLFVGGSFSSIGGQPRNGLAAVDAKTGALLPWDAALVTSGGDGGWVRSLATDGHRLYVSGGFASVGGQPRNGLAAVDPVSGLVTAWNPAVSGFVSGLAAAGGVIYAWGSFGSIGGQPRRNIAALDPFSGNATPWDANVGFGASINGVAATDSVIYVGGVFTQIAGADRAGLAAFDAATGQVTAWHPSFPNATVSALAASGSTVYAGGVLHLHDPYDSPCALVALDAATGQSTAWRAWADQAVTAISVGGGRVFASGCFAGCGTGTVGNLAALDLATARPLPWHPVLDGNGLCLATDGAALFVGGVFTSVDGQDRGGLAAFDRATGGLTAWNPSQGAHNQIGHLAVQGGLAFVECPSGGSFDGQALQKLQGIDIASGHATAWHPSWSGGNGYQRITGLIATNSRVYVYGEFDHVNGAPRRVVVATNPADGTLLSWDPHILPDPLNPSALGYANAALLRGSRLFVFGNWATVGGVAQPHTAALDTATALLAGAQPDEIVPPGGLADGDSVVVVGSAAYQFGLGSPGSRDGLLAFDPETGSMLPWYPGVYSPNNYGMPAVVTHAGEVIAGGWDDLIGGPYLRPSLVRVLPTDLLSPVVEVDPPDAASWVIGSRHTIGWQATDDRGVAAADLYLSRTGPSGPWELLAGGLTEVSSWEWTVTPPASPDCWLRVDARDHAGNAASGTAGPFAIAYTTDAPLPVAPATLSLDSPAPNPAVGIGRVTFALPAPAHVRIALFDLQGREVASVLDREMPAGRHYASLPVASLAPGLYYVRLQAAGVVATRRLVVVR